MKNEFNPQGLYKLRTTVTAGLLALPSVFVTAHQYGWQGLVVLATFTGILTGQAYVQPGRARIIDPGTHEDDALDQKVQQRATAMCNRMGVKPVYAATTPNPFITCQTNLETIYINRELAAFLEDGELDWVLAHEIDHVRNGGENKLRSPFKAAIGLSGLACTFATAGMLTGSFSVSHYTEPVHGLLATGATLFSLVLARASVTREAELRCDANALRAGGDPFAAIGALKKLYALRQAGASHSLFDRTCEIIATPLYEHPRLRTRIKNIEITTYRMHAESTARPAPQTP